MSKAADRNLIHAKNLVHEYDAWVRRVDSLEKAGSEEDYITLHRDKRQESFNELVRLVKIGLEND